MSAAHDLSFTDESKEGERAGTEALFRHASSATALGMRESSSASWS
jgi:hypothetical protein